MKREFKNATTYNRSLHDQTNFYTTISNIIFQDQRLGIIEKGLICQILSNSDEYIFNSTNLYKESKLSRNNYFNAIDKLILCGYLTKEKISSGWNWVINETPQTLNQQEIEKIENKINKKESKRKENNSLKTYVDSQISNGVNVNGVNVNGVNVNGVNVNGNNVNTGQIISNKEIIEKSFSNENSNKKEEKININTISENLNFQDFGRDSEGLTIISKVEKEDQTGRYYLLVNSGGGTTREYILNKTNTSNSNTSIDLDYQVLKYLDDQSKVKVNKTRIEFNLRNGLNINLSVFEKHIRNYYIISMKLDVVDLKNVSNEIISSICQEINNNFNSEINKDIIKYIEGFIK